MKFFAALVVLMLGAGCVSGRREGPIETRVITVPDGALVEFDGKPVGRAPAKIILPQDELGRLTGSAEVLALPNSEQHHLIAQRRVFTPAERVDRVPEKIMIDMTLGGTNAAPVEIAREEPPHIETGKAAGKRKYIDRGKPTQAVGIDRWNPGKY